MKKIILSLVLVSIIGLLTSVVLFLFDGSFYNLWNLFICSIISTSITLSLKLICTDQSSISKLAFYSGLSLNGVFIISVFNSGMLKTYFPFLLSGIFLFILLAINSHLINRTDKISLITRIIFWIACPLLMSILIFKLTEPIYFTILSILMILGSTSYIISSLLLSDIKKN